MVIALLEGRKGQTRRAVKLPSDTTGVVVDPGGTYVFGPGPHIKPQRDGDPPGHPRLRCPHGYPPDRLWVRETWAEIGTGFIYRATDGEHNEGHLWRPSIFMPRRASRITLEVTEVRVERLQDISEADAKAEGAELHDGLGVGHTGWRHDRDHGFVYAFARESFRALWESINGVGSWAANPWVWVISFNPMKPERKT